MTDIPRWMSEGAISLKIRGVDVLGRDFNWDRQRWEPKKEPLPERDSESADTLVCTKCKLYKDPEEFYKRPEKYSGGRGRAYHCKSCS